MKRVTKKTREKITKMKKKRKEEEKYVHSRARIRDTLLFL